MITIKNASQIAKMREAGALLHEVLEQLKGKIEPGITTKELDRYAEKLIRGYGAVPSFLNYEGYPASICASVDSQVVHGIPDESTVLREGQIISIDSGLILDGWQSDSAFTVGVGTVSPQAQRLIDVTEQSFFAALQVAREGYRVSDTAMPFSSTSRSAVFPRCATCAGMESGARCTRIRACRTLARRDMVCGCAGA